MGPDVLRRFEEGVLNKHSGISSWQALGNDCYRIARSRHNDTLDVLVSDQYAFSVADLANATSAHAGLACIVIFGPWNNYTGDAKLAATRAQIGLFKTPGFMGAIQSKEVWEYKALP